MIVISNPTAIVNEIAHIHALFDAGMVLFHVRKPNFNRMEMRDFIANIQPQYHTHLVLHQHHDLAEDFGIQKLHYPTKERQKETFKEPESATYLSTSTHSLTEFNQLATMFDAAFLSPIFPSISKKNHTTTIPISEIDKNRTNKHTKLIALGGITPENLDKIICSEFDDFALLGSIWQHKNPLEIFKTCQQIVRSY